MKDTGNLRGAALALAGTAAYMVAETTGSKTAKRVYDRIARVFEEEGQD